MMGVHEGQKEMFSYAVDLEQRVRADHPLRRVLAHVDFGFAREVVAHTYGYNGHVSLDPVVLVKLMFLLFHDNVKSERALLCMLPERLDYLWFLGYGLEDVVPHHSVLSKARARWGPRRASGGREGRAFRPGDPDLTGPTSQSEPLRGSIGRWLGEARTSIDSRSRSAGQFRGHPK